MELCCFGTQAIDLAKANGGVAAWLQAVGGLLAVIAAAAIAVTESFRAAKSVQREEARQLENDRRERERLVNFRLAALVLIVLARTRIEALETVLKLPHVRDPRLVCRDFTPDLASIERQLFGFPFHEMADGEAMDCFVQTRIAMSGAVIVIGGQAEREDRITVEYLCGLTRGMITNLTNIEKVFRARLKAF